MLWLDACQRAAETDAALDELFDGGPARDRVLYERACHYHAAVRRLRTAVAGRVTTLTGVGGHAPRRPIVDRHARS